MPATIAPEIALRARLGDAISHALSLNGKLEAIVPIRSKQSNAGNIFHGKIDHSAPPWNAGAANAVLDLHAQSREMEEWLRIALKLPRRARGGSSANTRKALEAVLRLAQGADDHAVKEHTRWLDGWCHRALIVLGRTEPPQRIPRIPGGKEPKCPWCENHTLRMLPIQGLIKCISPGCKDEENRKPAARMEYSEHLADWIIVWQDGIPGVPA